MAMVGIHDEKVYFVAGLFRSNPGLTWANANLAIKHKFGEGMKSDKIQAIKREVRANPEAYADQPTTAPREVIDKLEAVVKKNLQLREALRAFYNFFNKQDPNTLVFDDADMNLIESIEGLLK